MRKVFKEEELESSLSEHGYFTMQLLSEKEVSRLRQFHEENPPPDVDQEFYTTHWSQQKEYRQLVDNNVRPLLAKHALPLFNDYKDCFGYFFVKHPAEGSVFHIHQDWSLVDEEYFRGVTLWVALTDTDQQNGCLHVVPGSHLFGGNLRGTNIQSPFSQVEDLIEEKYCQPLPLKSGEAIFFDQRLLHYSPPNRSNETRLAAGLVTIPRETTFVHYYFDDNTDKVLKYIADDNFLLEMGFGESVRDKNYQIENEFYYQTELYTNKEFIWIYNNSITTKSKFTSIWYRLKNKLNLA